MAAAKKRKSTAAAKPEAGAADREPESTPAAADDGADSSGAAGAHDDGRGAATAAMVPATTTLTQAIRQVAPVARDSYARGRDQSQQMVTDFEAAIRQRPILSLFKAVGIGFVIGLIWR